MGYNGNNRGYSRRRSGHRGAYRSGERIMGNLINGLLGLGVLAVNEAAKSAQNNPQPNANNAEPMGFGCLVVAAMVLIPLGVFSFAVWGFPIVGQIIAFVIIACIYGLFKECAPALKKQRTYIKCIFWLVTLVLALYCSYKLMDAVLHHLFISDIYDILIIVLGAILPLASATIGYIVGIYEFKKKNKSQNGEKIDDLFCP